MELENISEFKSLPRIREKLSEYGFVKQYRTEDVILNEHAYIKAIPIVTTGSIRVMRTDEEGREILLYYIRPGEKVASCLFLAGYTMTQAK